MSNLTWGIASYDLPGLRPGLALHRLGEIREKFIGQFLSRTVDLPLYELGELAACLGLIVVLHQHAAALFGQLQRGAALGESGNAALALARDLLAVRRIEIAEH